MMQHVLFGGGGGGKCPHVYVGIDVVYVCFASCCEPGLCVEKLGYMISSFELPFWQFTSSVLALESIVKV